MNRAVLALAALAWVAGLQACDASPGEDPARTPLVVFAASSLTEAFRDLEEDFERSHPEVDVQLTFGGSQVLRLQIAQGAAADVFASANQAHMQGLVEAGHVAGAQVFAHNELVVVVPAHAQPKLHTFADLPEAQRLVLGTENVPVGLYTRRMLARAQAELGAEFVEQVRAHVVSEEGNVRLVRAKVALGEADAAIVYRTDAAASDEVRPIPIPEALNARASYTVGARTEAAHPDAAAQFIAFVRSERGRERLTQRGFVPEAP